MNKETLSSLLEGKMFRIPDYQRGYSLEKEHWNDFVNDIDTLVDSEVKNHYTGTIVIYQSDKRPTENYGVKKLELVDIVDGQQRLTTSCLYLSIIINELINNGLVEYEREKPYYLCRGTKCKLRLNEDSDRFFFDLLNTGTTITKAKTDNQRRICEAFAFLKDHLNKQLVSRLNPVEYLEDLYLAIMDKLKFTLYRIENESEIRKTLELINSRGTKK